MKANSLILVIVIGIATMIAGCGGGGGGDNGNTAPIASFTVAPPNGPVSMVFAFDASGCNDAQDGAAFLQVRWDWDNDGVWDTIFSVTKTAIHTYNTAGNYVVKMQVRDSQGNTSSTTREVIVNNETPTAAFTVAPAAGDTNTLFQFDASGCTDPQDPPGALQVRWDWDNDGTWDTDYSTIKTATHTYAAGGTHTVKLVVKDTDGNSSTTTRQVAVNSAPTAAFTVVPTTGGEGTSFAFNASGCADLQDASALLQVRWDWTNDGTWDTAYSTTKTANHTFGGNGTFTVKMEVKDTGGLTASTTRPIVVTSPPTAAFTVTPATGDTGTEFLFDASGSTDNEDLTSELQAQWDWNDDGVWDTAYTTTKTAYHTFTTAGTHTVWLRVKDTDGLTATISHSGTVTEAALPNAIRLFPVETYTPGTMLLVSIVVTPSAATVAYAYEDTPPEGWPVSNINNAGVYDAVNKKVKWGPFFDNNARTFTYTVTPPIGESGTKTFTGRASFDGTNVDTTGNRTILPQ